MTKIERNKEDFKKKETIASQKKKDNMGAFTCLFMIIIAMIAIAAIVMSGITMKMISEKKYEEYEHSLAGEFGLTMNSDNRDLSVSLETMFGENYIKTSGNTYRMSKNKKDKETFIFVNYGSNLVKIEDLGTNYNLMGSDTVFRETGCCQPIGVGTRWRTTEPVYVDGVNGDGLSHSSVLNAINVSINTWQTEIGTAYLSPITLSPTRIFIEDVLSENGRNEVLFVNLADPGVLAFTRIDFVRINGILQISEIDMVFNDAFTWSTDESGPQSSEVDLINIGAHEAGHSLGLNHPSSSCTTSTMFATAALGETIKRDLTESDIICMQTLYSNFGTEITSGASNINESLISPLLITLIAATYFTLPLV